MSTLFDNFSVEGYCHHLPRNEFAAAFERLLCHVLKTAAAGNLHSHHRHAFNVVVFDYFAKLFGIVGTVKLGAANQGDAVFNEFLVKISVGKGGAVGGDKKICAVKVGCVCRHKLDLHRPLRKAGQGLAYRRSGGFFLGAV